MNDFQSEFQIYFPLLFVGLWLTITIGLGFVSGWYALAREFPDRLETPLLTLKNQSGSLGGVGMNRVLTLSVCPSGLRIGMMRIFGPFSRAFFVPWDAISVTRYERFFLQRGKIGFGKPSVGSLTLPAEVTDRLARAAGTSWPEDGAFPEESNAQAGSRIFKQWVVSTCFAATFFIVAPRLMAPNGAAFPPIAVAILFPAVVFGIGSIIRYLMRKRP